MTRELTLPLFRRPRSSRIAAPAPASIDLELVARAIAGDWATIVGNDLKRGQRHVQERCASTSTVMLGCLSCRQPLASLLQLQFHLEDAPDQTHVIARQCGEHGWESL